MQLFSSEQNIGKDLYALRGHFPTQMLSCASQHLLQRNTSEQIDQIQLIFEGNPILQITIVPKVN